MSRLMMTPLMMGIQIPAIRTDEHVLPVLILFRLHDLAASSMGDLRVLSGSLRRQLHKRRRASNARRCESPLSTKPMPHLWWQASFLP